MRQQTTLIIGLTWPEPTTTAAGLRTMQLIRFFRNDGYNVVFASAAIETEMSSSMHDLDIEKVSIQLNDSSFDGLLKKLSPEIVVFDRFLTEEQFGWRVTEFAPDALRILDTQDLHSLRRTRQQSHQINTTFSTDEWVQSDLTKREIASIFRCDLTLVVSTYEMKLLSQTVKVDSKLLLYLPIFASNITPSQVSDWLTFDNRKNFIFLGNGKHDPNVDALIWLKKEIWPLIRKKLANSELWVYGAYLPERIKILHDKQQGFIVNGWVRDAEEALGRARVNLAPLRFGAGVKGKLLLAMQAGTPSITTAIGAEGLSDGHDWCGHVLEHPKEIADAAVTLYEDATEWGRAQQKGINIVNDLFDKNELHQRLKVKMVELRQNLYEHRTKNFIGAMLRHQSLQATKYLSKWIEAKNTLKLK